MTDARESIAQTDLTTMPETLPEVVYDLAGEAHFTATMTRATFTELMIERAEDTRDRWAASRSTARVGLQLAERQLTGDALERERADSLRRLAEYDATIAAMDTAIERARAWLADQEASEEGAR